MIHAPRPAQSLPSLPDKETPRRRRGRRGRRGRTRKGVILGRTDPLRGRAVESRGRQVDSSPAGSSPWHRADAVGRPSHRVEVGRHLPHPASGGVGCRPSRGAPCQMKLPTLC